MMKIENLEKYCEIILDGGEVVVERKYVNVIIDNLICYEENIKLDISYNSLNDFTVYIKKVK